MNSFKLLLLAVICSIAIDPVLHAQTTAIPIETKNVAIVLQTDKNNHLKIVHTGRALASATDYETAAAAYRLTSQGANLNNAAYTVAGINNNFVEPAIAVVHADGNNSLDLVYEKQRMTTTPEGATLTVVTLKDAVYPFYVDLCFKAWKNEDVIEQWTEIRHTEKGKVTLNKYASANVYLFDDRFYLTSYNGNWAKEMQPELTQLKQGMHTIESRLGTRENLIGTQNFMLAMDQPATETTGTVLMGQLAWNGNYSIQFETDTYKKCTW